jgi:hypothetical protein
MIEGNRSLKWWPLRLRRTGREAHLVGLHTRLVEFHLVQPNVAGHCMWLKGEADEV